MELKKTKRNEYIIPITELMNKLKLKGKFIHATTSSEKINEEYESVLIIFTED